MHPTITKGKNTSKSYVETNDRIDVAKRNNNWEETISQSGQFDVRSAKSTIVW